MYMARALHLFRGWALPLSLDRVRGLSEAAELVGVEVRRDNQGISYDDAPGHFDHGAS